MAQELRWEDFEAAFNALSDEEHAELEASLFSKRAEQQALIDEFLEPTPLERQRDELYGWLYRYKKTIPIPELHNNLREFHNFIRPEVMEILENESRDLGPCKFKLKIAVKIIKEANDGIEEIRSYTVQRDPILVNAFNREIVEQDLDALADAQEEILVKRLWVKDATACQNLVVKIDFVLHFVDRFQLVFCINPRGWLVARIGADLAQIRTLDPLHKHLATLVNG